MELNIDSKKKLNIISLKAYDVINNTTLIDRLKKNKISASLIYTLKKYKFSYYLKLWYLKFRASSSYLVLLKIIIFIFNKRRSVAYDIESFRNYPPNSYYKSKTLLSPFLGSYYAPFFFSTKGGSAGLSVKPEIYNFPKIQVFSTNNVGAFFIGGSNWVFLDNKKVLIHELYNLDRDLFSEVLHDRFLVNYKKKKCVVPNFPKLHVLNQDATLEKAGIFLDSCATNYAHWLTEVLPRIYIFCQNKEYDDIPLVIDDGLHRNIIQTLSIVVSTQRKIFTVPKNMKVRVNNSFIVSPTGYVPWEQIETYTQNEGAFHGDLFLDMRNFLINAISTLPKPSLKAKKIYLKRNSTYRMVENQGAVEEFLITQGFSIISPELLSFHDQINLFANADIIVGPSGAAWSNLIFTGSSAKLVILFGKGEGLLYGYWQRLANALGTSVNYVLGEIKKGERIYNHSNFTISLDELDLALKNV